jgi:hypothetical protein
MGTGCIPQEVEMHGREADYSSPFSAEVKNGKAIPPLITCPRGILLHYIIKYRHNYNFTFTLYIYIYIYVCIKRIDAGCICI